LTRHDANNFRILSALISELEVDEDFLFQSWRSLSGLRGEELSSFIEIIQAVRAFATMRESTSMAYRITDSIMKHLHTSDYDESPIDLPEMIRTGLSLIFNKLKKKGVRVDLDLPAENKIKAAGKGLFQIYLGVLLAATHLLAKSKSTVAASGKSSEAKKIITVSLIPNGGDDAGFSLAINAKGIDVEDKLIQAIWSEDYQAPPDTPDTRVADESIFNLAFCRQLAQKSGGLLEMQQTKNSFDFVLNWSGI